MCATGVNQGANGIGLHGGNLIEQPGLQHAGSVHNDINACQQIGPIISLRQMREISADPARIRTYSFAPGSIASKAGDRMAVSNEFSGD